MVQYSLTQQRFEQIRAHYQRLQPIFPDGYGYLAGHSGWYTYKDDKKCLSKYQDFLDRIRMTNTDSLTLFSTINLYETWSDIWKDIPGEVTELADKDAIAYQVNIDIDMNDELQLVDHQEYALDVAVAAKEFFNNTNCIVCVSGNGLYIKFPASSMNLLNTTIQQKSTIRDAWNRYMEMFETYLNKECPVAMQYFKVDRILNSNRQIKAIGSVHKSNGYVVLPITDKNVLPLKYVWELTDEDYNIVEIAINIIYDNPNVTKPEDGKSLYDIIPNSIWKQVEIDSQNKYNGPETEFQQRDDKIPLKYLSKDPILRRLFNKTWTPQHPNHCAITMVYFLSNMGYNKDEIETIITEYPWITKQMLSDGIRHGMKTWAPKYETIMSIDKTWPSPGNKTDFGNIMLTETQKQCGSPIKYMEYLYQKDTIPRKKRNVNKYEKRKWIKIGAHAHKSK